MEPFTQNLFELSQADAQLLVANNLKNEVAKERHDAFESVRLKRERLAKLEARRNQSSTKQTDEETKLRDEEKKILDRRKQLTSMGGMRSARFMEREIDIASRSVNALEEKAMVAIQDLEKVGEEIDSMKGELEVLEAAFEEAQKGFDEKLAKYENQLSSVQSKRDAIAPKVNDASLRLYMKIRTRYPADAVVMVQSGACQGCFRSLPAQLANQILAGRALYQCPSCSRILVAEATAAAVSAES